jgi:cytochrome P450
MSTAAAPDVAELPLRHGGDPLSPRLPLDELLERRDERLIPYRFPNGVVGWVTTNADDFKAALSDPRLHAKRFLGEPQPCPVSVAVPDMPGFIPSMNGPEHLRIRRLAAGFFSVKAIEKMRPFIEETVDKYLGDMEASGPPVDLITSFCLPIPSEVIGHIIGVPRDQAKAFQKAAEETIGQRKGGKDDPNAAAEAVAKLHEILGAVVTLKRQRPQDDLISHLTQAGDPQLSDVEITGLCTNLLLAGHDTTAASSAVALTLLLQNPEQLEKFVSDPDKVPARVEELVRMVFVIAENGAGIPRLVTEDMEFAGYQLKQGDWVMPATGTANIDPEVCPHAALELDLDRDAGQHVAFGYGPHTCLGQHLARAELQVMLANLLAKFPTIRLTEPPETLDWNDEAFIYRMYEMPVTW